MILLYLFAVERVVFLQSFSELQDFSKRSVFISLIFFYDRFVYHLNFFLRFFFTFYNVTKMLYFLMLLSFIL